jgi:hypothetical protein
VESEAGLAAAGRSLEHDEVTEVGIAEALEHHVEEVASPTVGLGEGIEGAQLLPSQHPALGVDVGVGEGEGFLAEGGGLGVLPLQPSAVGREVVVDGGRGVAEAVEALDDGGDGGRGVAVLDHDRLELVEDVRLRPDRPEVDRDDPESRARRTGGEHRPLAAAPVGPGGLVAHDGDGGRALQEPAPQLVGPALARLDVDVTQHLHVVAHERGLELGDERQRRFVAALVADEDLGSADHPPIPTCRSAPPGRTVAVPARPPGDLG